MNIKGGLLTIVRELSIFVVGGLIMWFFAGVWSHNEIIATLLGPEHNLWQKTTQAQYESSQVIDGDNKKIEKVYLLIKELDTLRHQRYLHAKLEGVRTMKLVPLIGPYIVNAYTNFSDKTDSTEMKAINSMISKAEADLKTELKSFRNCRNANIDTTYSRQAVSMLAYAEWLIENKSKDYSNLYDEYISLTTKKRGK